MAVSFVLKPDKPLHQQVSLSLIFYIKIYEILVQDYLKQVLFLERNLMTCLLPAGYLLQQKKKLKKEPSHPSSI